MALILLTRLFGCAYGIITIILLLRILSLVAVGGKSRPSAIFSVFLWPLLVFTESGRNTLDNILREHPDEVQETPTTKKRGK